MKRRMIHRRLALLALTGAVLASACRGSSGKSYSTLTFPPGFLWGTATASYQVEGGNTKDDWYAWEHLPGKILGGDTAGRACDEYHLYDQDFALAASLGQNAHRFSLEWSRIEPVFGARYDTAEIAHYHAELASLKAHGLTPVVTLEHYTLPLWADNPALGPNTSGTAGFGSPVVQSEFVRWAGDMAAEYGAQVDNWIVFNEPMVVPLASYEGVFPPDLGTNPPLSAGLAQVFGEIRAHAAAYDAIHARDTISAGGG